LELESAGRGSQPAFPAYFDASQSIHTTGQSGHPFNNHYDDFIEPWQNGAYHPMWFSRDAVLEAAVNHLVLQPPQEE
jgi:penicillin amidase